MQRRVGPWANLLHLEHTKETQTHANSEEESDPTDCEAREQKKVSHNSKSELTPRRSKCARLMPLSATVNTEMAAAAAAAALEEGVLVTAANVFSVS